MILREKISCSVCPNENCYIKQHCSDDCLCVMEPQKFQSVYQKGQYIIREGDPVHGIFYIQHGKVKVFTYGRNRTPSIVRLAANGDMVGHRGFGKKTYSVNIATLEDSRICFFENDLFYNTCIDNSRLAMQLANFFSHELSLAEKRLKYQAQMTVKEKIAEALLFIMAVFGINRKKELDVYMSRKDMAAIAGTSKELVIRKLSELEDEKIIVKSDRGRRIAILDEKKLREYLKDYNLFE